MMHDQNLLGVIDSEDVQAGFCTKNHEVLLTAIANVAAITLLELRRTADL